MNCPKCGDSHVLKDGHVYTKAGPKQQYVCVKCEYGWREKTDNPKEEFGTQTVKTLLVDIETAPMHGRFWRLGKQVIGMEQIIKDWFILGWSAKWLFDSETHSAFVTPEEAINRDDERILRDLWPLMDDASIIIGHNFKGFDGPNITTRFIYHRIDPVSPFQVIDTLMAVKPLGFSSNKLKYLCEFLEVKKKLDTDYQLWIDCEAGNKKSLAYMEKYCRRDIVALEEVFVELRPYIKTGVNLAVHNHSGVNCCHACGSPDLTEKGCYYTTVSRFTSYRCNHCGAYSRQRTNDLSIANRKALLSPIAR
jgi:hypothetical protein